MNISRLRDLQSHFCEFLQYGRHEKSIVEALRLPGRSQGVQRLDVYRNGYFIRLEKALARNFPVTDAVLGQEDFAQLAGLYVLEHPSRHPNLRNIGCHFPAWLRGCSRVAAGDLAAVEWAALRVFDGPDTVPATVSCLDSVAPDDWATLSIMLAPTLTLLSLSSNADRVWIAKAQGIELSESPVRHIAVARESQFRPGITDLDTDTFLVLTALKSEMRLSVVNEQLSRCQDPREIPSRVATALHFAFAKEWVAGIDLNQQGKQE